MLNRLPLKHILPRLLFCYGAAGMPLIFGGAAGILLLGRGAISMAGAGWFFAFSVVLGLTGGLLAAGFLIRPTPMLDNPLDDLKAAFVNPPQNAVELFCREGEALSVCLNQLEQATAAGSFCNDAVSQSDPLTDDLKSGRLLFDAFMAHLPAMATVKDASGRYLYVSPGCRRLLEKEPAELLGRTDGDLWPSDVATRSALFERQALDGRQPVTFIDSYPQGGGQCQQAITKFAITQPHGTPLIGSIVFDITDKLQAEEHRNQLEQQLIQAQKMEAIGTLASGIAHDFNNILGAIFGYVELARLDSPHNENLQAQLDQVLKAAQRAKELVRQILTFSRKHEHDRKPVDIKPLVSETLKLLRASLPATIRIRSELNSGGVMVMADATQVHQVMMNLCTNAAFAMEGGGGELTVRLEKIGIQKESGNGQGLAVGNYVALSVQDTGQGISPALQERIFEPYFTTKPLGKGTGMGLAVVHGIVKSHGGTIKVESRIGGGSCFSVFLPVTESVVPLPGVKITALPQGCESILFVEDEPFLVDLGRKMLTRLGYRVECQTNPLDALQLIKSEPQRFDLLITDMTMPHMTGEALIRQMAVIRPDLPAILCTGYSHLIQKEDGLPTGVQALLMKPLTIGDLAYTIRKVLDCRCMSGSYAAVGQ